MDLLTLEVDGSLANPYAAAAVVICTAMLSVIALAVIRSIRLSGRMRLKLAGLLMLFVITPAAPQMLGTLCFWITDPRFASVGF